MIRQKFWKIGLLIGLAWCSWAYAQQPSFLTNTQVTRLLLQLQSAALKQNYQGIFVFQKQDGLQSARLTHFISNHQEYEYIESLDGLKRQQVRANQQLYVYLPEKKRIIVEKHDQTSSFPALLNGSVEQVLSVYQVQSMGQSRVADRKAEQYWFKPKDVNRFAYKIWVDQNSGLMLRIETLNESQTILQQMAFTQFSLDAPSLAEQNRIIDLARNFKGWTLIKSPIESINLKQLGWVVQVKSLGFSKLTEIKRPMAGRLPNDPIIEVLQTILTDGISMVSVFIEPAQGQVRQAGLMSSGATNILIKPLGQFWITVVGEVPASTLQKIYQGVSYISPRR